MQFSQNDFVLELRITGNCFTVIFNNVKHKEYYRYKCFHSKLCMSHPFSLQAVIEPGWYVECHCIYKCWHFLMLSSVTSLLFTDPAVMHLQEELIEDDDLRKSKGDHPPNSYIVMCDSALTPRDNELQHASDASGGSNNSSTVRVDVSRSTPHTQTLYLPLVLILRMIILYLNTNIWESIETLFRM